MTMVLWVSPTLSTLALWRIDDDALANDLSADQTKFELVVAAHRLARRWRQQLHATLNVQRRVSCAMNPCAPHPHSGLLPAPPDQEFPLGARIDFRRGDSLVVRGTRSHGGRSAVKIAGRRFFGCLLAAKKRGETKDRRSRVTQQISKLGKDRERSRRVIGKGHHLLSNHMTSITDSLRPPKKSNPASPGRHVDGSVRYRARYQRPHLLHRVQRLRLDRRGRKPSDMRRGDDAFELGNRRRRHLVRRPSDIDCGTGDAALRDCSGKGCFIDEVAARDVDEY